MRFLFVFIIFVVTACSRYPADVEYALKLAGNNRSELERVLEYYHTRPKDSLKYHAACFLIVNMPGHYAVNPDWDQELFQVYEQHVAISQKHKWSVEKEWGKEIDSLQNVHNELYHRISLSNIEYDIQTITSDGLIANIDLAFKAWEENKHTHNFSFETFCEYILPYRFKDEIIFDDSRKIFYQRHAKILERDDLALIATADTILYQYKDIFFNYYYGSRIPIYSVAALEKIKRGQCNDRSWYNSLLFASLGMAVSTDFVPARGNRNNAHTWNTLITEEKVYPFDPFWLDDRWNYTEIYDNIAIDEAWGKFRLPKVYRHTYSVNKSSLPFDPSIKKADIPPLFLDTRIKDVSFQYFDTTNVSVQLFDMETMPSHAYICVYGYRSWIPVQWGKVEGKQASFKGMGRDIVYMVCSYNKGNLAPISQAFYLDGKGKVHNINISGKKGSLYVRSIGVFLEKEEKVQTLRPHYNATIIGVNEDEGLQDTIHTIIKKSDVWENIIPVRKEHPYRYVDIYLPTDTVSFCEVEFYTCRNEKLEVKLVTPITPLSPSEQVDMITDHLSATGFRGVIKYRQKPHKVRFDLGEVRAIEAINYIPYTKSKMLSQNIYKLYYWDNGWHYAGEKEGNGNFLVFENVPIGTLYRMENEQTQSQKNAERIFMYKDGIIQWF